MLFNKIKKLCDERNISIYALEKECGLGNATIRGWKNSSPNIETLMKVANYFGVPLEYFVEDRKEKNA